MFLPGKLTVSEIAQDVRGWNLFPPAPQHGEEIRGRSFNQIYKKYFSKVKRL